MAVIQRGDHGALIGALRNHECVDRNVNELRGDKAALSELTADRNIVVVKTNDEIYSVVRRVKDAAFPNFYGINFSTDGKLIYMAFNYNTIGVVVPEDLVDLVKRAAQRQIEAMSS